MKNKIIIGFLTLVVFTSLIITGCASSKIVGENKGNFGEHVRVPVKDFTTVGLVFTEVQLTNNTTGSSQGQIFTYQALLKEAQKINADAIINVVMDKKTETTGTSTIETWYGSALGIRYTDTLRKTGTVTTRADGTTTTSQTNEVYFNDGSTESAGTGSGGNSASGGGISGAVRGIRQ